MVSPTSEEGSDQHPLLVLMAWAAKEPLSSPHMEGCARLQDTPVNKPNPVPSPRDLRAPQEETWKVLGGILRFPVGTFKHHLVVSGDDKELSREGRKHALPAECHLRASVQWQQSGKPQAPCRSPQMAASGFHAEGLWGSPTPIPTSWPSPPELPFSTPAAHAAEPIPAT